MVIENNYFSPEWVRQKINSNSFLAGQTRCPGVTMLYIDPTAPDWPDAQSDYEQDALDFCRAWRSDVTEFTLHTSGSTGTPKPIRLTRRQLRASARLTGKTFGLVPGDVLFVCLNVRYIAGVMMLVRGLELGLPMYLTEPAANPLASLDPTNVGH